MSEAGGRPQRSHVWGCEVEEIGGGSCQVFAREHFLEWPFALAQ
jgi:hypothetical protein